MKRLSILLLTLLLITIPAGLVAAAPAVREIGPGETINSDMTLLDEDLTVAAGAIINGDVVVIDGDVTIEGKINGDLLVLDGDVTLNGAGSVVGDCVVLDGHGGGVCRTVPLPEFLNYARTVGLNLDFVGENFPPGPAGREWPNAGHYRPWWGARLLGGIGSAVVQSFIMGLLALIVATAAPDHLNRVQAAVRQKPVASGVIGFLTTLAVPSLIAIILPLSLLIFIIGIVIIGIPLSLLLAFGLVAGGIMGWIALGVLLGERLAERTRLNLKTPARRAALGTAVLTLAFGLLAVVPLMPEGILRLVALFVGLGAVALTQFGTKIYPRPAPKSNQEKVDVVLRTLPDDDVT